MLLTGATVPGEPPPPRELLETLVIHRLAERWYCTPDFARAQPVEDIEFATALIEADAAVAEFNHAKDEARRRASG